MMEDAGLRVLVVSQRFPPFSSVGALSVSRVVDALVARGHRVEVVSDASQDGPTTLHTNAPVRVHWVPDPLHASRVDSGSRAERPGMRVGHGLLRGVHRTPRFVRLAARPLRRWLAVPDTKGLWVISATGVAARIARERRADVVLATGPPHSGLLVGARASRRLGIPLVFWMRDLWMDNHYRELWASSAHERVGAVKRWILERIERRTLAEAAIITTATPTLSEIVHRRFPDSRVETVMNGIDVLPSEPSPGATRGAGPLTIVSTGQLMGSVRDPRPAFAAVARQRGVCPAKVFEYLGARRPVLLLGPREGVAGRMITETSSGLVSRDPGEIATWLTGLASQRRSGPIPDLPVDAVRGLARGPQIDRLEALLRDAAARP